MKYDQDTALREILLRGDRLRKQKAQAAARLYSACSAVLCILLVLCIGSVSRAGAAGMGPTAYGAFLLPADAGGYVLTAVLAFLLGVIITLVILKRRNKRRM